MATVIHASPDVFNSILFGEQHPANINYFRNQLEKLNNIIPTSEISAKVFSNVENLYNRFNSDEVNRLTKAALRGAAGLFLPNQIQYLNTIGNLQNAPVVMQRWIMANPIVREQYHKQKCEGYGDSYVDMEPNSIGIDHYDYRRVNTGIIKETETGWMCTTHFDELKENDRPLDVLEKDDILNTWDIIEMFMRAKHEDPTSPWNNKL